VDFSLPPGEPFDEILVTGQGGPSPHHLFDLAGTTIYTRKSSSYYESLLALNEQLKAAQKKPIQIIDPGEYLEDEDLLQMMQAGLIPAIVMDSYKAKFWALVYDKVKLHPDIKLRSGGKTAWAFRKNSPQLAEQVNGFLDKNRKGTLLYNMLKKRYFGSVSYLKNNTSDTEQERFKAAVDLFRKYGDQYNFPYLLLMAQAYQESGLDHSKKSHRGAVGIMQILPSTAADPNVAISNIDELEANIHAGTKYLRFMVDRYFSDPEIDRLNKGLFAFASYNAGPAKVTRLRKEANEKGFDPNIWFGNVEVIAANRIGRETVQYVSNIYKYYIAYTLSANKQAVRTEEKTKLEQQLEKTK
jgi:membrane-bound lytic murein transglycosylase MltF